MTNLSSGLFDLVFFTLRSKVSSRETMLLFNKGLPFIYFFNVGNVAVNELQQDCLQNMSENSQQYIWQ